MLPNDLDRRRAIAALRRLGFTEVREGVKHTILTRPYVPGHVVLPRHARIRRETLRSELHRAGIPVDEFMEAY